MKKQVLSFSVAAVLPLSLWAQEPIITAWKLNTNNTFATYYDYVGNPPNQTVQLITMTELADVLAVCYTADSVWIQSDGLTTQFGPWLNPGDPIAQNYTFRFPRNPQEASTKTDAPTIGPVGVLINGVPVYSNSNATSYDPNSNSNVPSGLGIWNAEAYYNEGISLDSTFSAHVQQQGAYHTHATPSNMYDYVPSSQHSPLIGFAFDGYPIYGPYGYDDPNDAGSSIVRIETSYALRSITQRHVDPNGNTLPSQQWGPDVSASFPLGMYMEDYAYTASSGHLDEYNGRFCKTPEYPNGTYAYFVTMAANGDPAYPYFIGNQYYGVVAEDNLNVLNPNITMPSSGVTCGQSVGINSIRNEKTFTAYPNPADNVLYVEFDEMPTAIVVYNALGQIVATPLVQNGRVEIATAAWQTGLYMVSLQYSEGIVNKMVTVQR